jgi:hypothetical protein
VNILAQGNELVVTGLKDALLPAHSNQEGTNDDQDINLGYESTEEITTQIKREKARTEAQLRVHSKRPTNSKVSKSLSSSKMRGDKEPKRTRRSGNR